MKTLMANALLSKSESSVDSTKIVITPNGIKINRAFQSDIALLAEYKKEFFKEIIVEGESEEFMLNQKLLDKLTTLVFKAEYITIEKKGKKILVTGDSKDDRYSQTVDALTDEGNSPFGVEATQVGLLPTSKGAIVDTKFRTLVTPEVLIASIPYPHMQINFVNNVMEVLAKGDDETELQRPIAIKQLNGEQQDCQVKVNVKMFQALASKFVGEVWLSGDERKVILSQTNTDYSLTYALSAMLD